jgi:hypothetical protein
MMRISGIELNAVSPYLVPGRQALYFRYFLRGDTFRDTDVERYSWAYRDGKHLRTAFKLYRAFEEDGKKNAHWNETVSLPIVIGLGEYDIFAKFLPEIAKGMTPNGCTNAATGQPAANAQSA